MENDKSHNFLRKNLPGGSARPNSSNRWLENGGASMGKLPPQAIDLEEAVLGALMIEKDALNSVIDILKAESFYKESHQRIYNAIITLFTNSEPIDLLTVTNQLRQLGELEMVGGAQYVTTLTTKINSAANIEYHARVVAQSAMKREMISVASKILQDAFEDTTDVFTLLDTVEQSLFKISESNIRKNYADMSAIMTEALRELERRREQKDGLTGVPSGFTQLDRLTSGWQPTELIILAARPAMGKTAFVVSSLRNAAVDFGMPVAIFSLEMSAVQLVNRMISAEAELDSEKLKKGNLAPHEWTQLHQRIDRLMRAPIYIDDTPALSILELRAKCRRLKQQHDIQMIVIDYLQLMQGDGGKGGGNREQEIASISRALKNLAKELNVPVIALSQLSRAVETRGGDKRPQLSDLRESGSIEQDADMVAFLYRPEYYGFTQDDAGNSVQGVGEVIIAKNRSGSLDTIQLRFIGKYTKFADLDGYYSPNPSTTPSGANAATFGNDAKMPPSSSFDTSPPVGGTFKSKANDLGGMNFPPPNPSEEPPF
ncbi:replicative DNA helicase [Runella sp. MFBS21]|uniref:replicative DNA helicase n=1 Tax=Runella sp. MFBS21 TaxID=3034018 RepID=UPI0023F97EFA|nr:replicative DNA helicase [Runella sp. MFBS21]MDF7819187.1 replicative DNA helicase [Runella sp. MFBS21]